MRKKITASGVVERRPWGVGSKSEHEAVMLVPKTGQPMKLRRLGGHPFSDKKLDQLVGKHLVIQGTLISAGILVFEEENMEEVAA